MSASKTTMDDVSACIEAGLDAGMNVADLLHDLERQHDLAALALTNETLTLDGVQFHSEPIVALARWLSSLAPEERLSAETRCCYQDLVDVGIMDDPDDEPRYYHIGTIGVESTLLDVAELSFEDDWDDDKTLRRHGDGYLTNEAAREAAMMELEARVREYCRDHNPPGEWTVSGESKYIELCWSCSVDDDAMLAMGPDVPDGMEQVPCDAPWTMWGGREIIADFSLGSADDSGCSDGEDEWGNEMYFDWVRWNLQM